MSSYSIVWRDLSALRMAMFAIFLPILILLLLPILFLPMTLPGSTGGGNVIYTSIVAGVALIAVPSLFGYFANKRVKNILHVLSEGEHVPGRISHVWYSSPWPLTKTPRGTLEYVYLLDGKSYAASTQVFQTAATSGFKLGDEVTVAVKPERPEDAYVVDLYRRDS